MRPADVQQIGDQLAIRWEGGAESYVRLEELRKHCPCAGCQGETDVLGRTSHGPAHPLSAASFQLRKLIPVGSYAIQPVWGDGHATGIYSFDYLRKLADESQP